MLSRIELHRYNQAVLAVHATPSLAQWSANLLHVLRLVVSGDIAVVNWRGAEGVVATAYDPQGAIPAEINAAVHRFLHQNPLYLHRRGAPRSISDVLSRREWHRTDLYAEAYGRLGQEDGLALDIPLSRSGVLTLNMTRARRGFRDTERLGLRLIEPHVQACWQRLQAQERLRAAAVAHDGATPGRLTAREREVLLWVANGLRNQQIAEQLGIRPATVKRHLENLYAKLGVGGRADARMLLERAATPALDD
jgi:DNA-binding CsgD family transcriptional regulator